MKKWHLFACVPYAFAIILFYTNSYSVFMFMLGQFASGLVIYWVANNTITFIQQYAIMASQGVKPDIFGNIKETFKRSKDTS